MNRLILFLSLFLSLWCFSVPVAGQSQRSTITASNGTEITIYSDSFAGHYEYTAPAIHVGDVGSVSGVLLVAAVSEHGQVRFFLSGFASYGGTGWHFFNGAVFRGGAAANFVEQGRDVGSCGRYGGCSHTENFQIRLTQADINQHAESGNIPLQVRAGDGTALLFNVPISYIQAVQEVSSRGPSGTPLPPSK